MTPEELAAKLAELEDKSSKLEAKNAELEARVNPPAPDPDKAYQPKSWKELDDKVDAKAEAAALRIIENAQKKESDERKRQEDEVAANGKKIEETFKRLEEAGEIEKTENVNDAGAKQRAQILGALVSLGGQHIDKAVTMAKSAWEQGFELDFDRNDATVRFVRSGGNGNPNRDAFVGSSASRVPAPARKGAIDLRGVRGDLDESQRRWEAANGKA